MRYLESAPQNLWEFKKLCKTTTKQQQQQQQQNKTKQKQKQKNRIWDQNALFRCLQAAILKKNYYHI